MAEGDNHTLRIVDGCHDSNTTAMALLNIAHNYHLGCAKYVEGISLRSVVVEMVKLYEFNL